jgi:hypothetical protein
MSYLYEFERTLELTGVIHYKNWYKGELIQGPKISKYWITCRFMYDANDMPDPDAALRLKKIGCIVGFEKKTLRRPIKVLSSDDWEDQTSKKAKIEKVPVWIVSIKMPMKYIKDNYDDVNMFIDELENDEFFLMDEPASEVPQDEQEGDNFSNFTGGNRI